MNNKEIKSYINEVIEDCIIVDEKIGSKSSIYKILKAKLVRKYKLEGSLLREALVMFETELASVSLLKVSRTSYDTKEFFKADFREFLETNKHICRDKHNANRFLLFNKETETYEQVSINISKVTSIVQEVTRNEMIENRKVSKKETKENLK